MTRTAIAGWLHNLRVQRGLTMAELGEQMGVTVQQIHKYESGANRLTAERILDVVRSLGGGEQFLALADAPVEAAAHDRGLVEIMRAVGRLSASQRSALRTLLLAMGGGR